MAMQRGTDPRGRRTGPVSSVPRRPAAPDTPLVPISRQPAARPKQRRDEAAAMRARKKTVAKRSQQRPVQGKPAGVTRQAGPAGGKRISYGEALRRRRRRRIATGLFVAVVLAAGLFASLRVLLKVDTITVTGETPYTPEQIINALPFEVGDSMLTISGTQTADKLMQTLPYLEQVNVIRRLPDSVELEVTAAQETYYVNSLSGWAVLSSGFKVLRVTMEEPAGLIAIGGVEADNPVPGTAMALMEEDRQDALQKLITALENTQFPAISRIDMESVYDMSVQYGAVRVVVGTVNELEEKLEWAKYLLEDKNVQGEQSGTLDVSTRNSEGRLTGHWLPD